MMTRRLQSSKLAVGLWSIAGGVSIRVKVLGIVVGVIILLGTFVIVQMRSVLHLTLSAQKEEQGIALAGTIGHDVERALADNDMSGLPLLLVERKIHYSTESHNTRVDYIVVEDVDETIIASVGDYPPRSTLLQDRSHGSQHPVFIVNDGQAIEIHHALIDGYRLRLGLSRSGIMQTVNQVSLQLFATTLVMVAFGFAAAFLLTWILTRPILDLLQATHNVAKGDYSQRVPRWAEDEIGMLADAFNQMTASLEQAERERIDRERLREQYINDVILAQENERQRIARELHDSTSQTLTSLLVGLQNLKHIDEPPQRTDQINDLREIISGTLDEIRGIAWRLRPSALDDMGLVSAIENYVQRFHSQYDIPVEMVFSGLNQRLQSELETTIYRIVQEGLTNIARYAQATTVSLIIRVKNGQIHIVIEDNGIGFDPVSAQIQQDSLGLKGIRERAGLFGGTLQIESQPAHGASLFIKIPFATEGQANNA